MHEWSSGFLHFLQFQSEFVNKEVMIWATVSSRSYFIWLYRAPSLAAKNIINLILMSTILLCCWKKLFAMTSAFSWPNSISLCPASFCTPRTNLPVTPGVSWLPTFAFQSPIMKRTSCCVLVLKGLIDLRKTVQLQLLQHYWLGHRLGLLWYWMVCLGNKQRSFCLFWDCIQVLHFRLFFDYDGYSISSEGFLPTVVDIMVIWVKFTHSNPFY